MWPVRLILVASVFIVVNTSIRCFGTEPEPFCGHELEDPTRQQVPPIGHYVAKLIFISFNNTNNNCDGDVPCVQDLPPYYITDLPNSLSAFLAAESRGQLTIACSTLTDPNHPDRYWVAANPLSYYQQLEDAGSDGWKAVNGEILETIRGVYGQVIDCDLLFFFHRYKIATDWAGNSGTGLSLPIDDVTTAHAGITVNIRTSRSPAANIFSYATLKFIVQHELGHVLYLGHTAADSTMSYGVYAVMRPSVIHETGFVPFNPVDLARLGWVAAPQPIVEEALALSLHDLQGDSPNYLCVDLQAFGAAFANEHLRLSYHSGIGSAYGVYPSTGVSIWHVQDNWWDLEQANGRYGNPDLEINPAPVDSLDRMDRRSSYPLGDEHFAKYYRGHETDFFQVAMGGITEFSYRTNPSTFGSEGAGRLARQSVPLSLTFLMTLAPQGHVSVDVLAAPHEKVLSPSGPLAFVEGQPIAFTLDNYFYQADCPSWLPDCNIIEAVAVWYSPHGGGEHSWEQIASAPYVIPQGGGNMVLPLGWEQFSPHHYTSNGRLRLEYPNSLTSFNGRYEYPGTITVAGRPIPRETIVAPAGGEKYAGGETYAVQWTDYWAGYPEVQIVGVDLFLSYDSGGTYALAAQDIAYVLEGGVNTYLWTVPESPVSDQVRLRLGFHSVYPGDPQADPVYAESESAGDFLVYALGAKYVDVTAEAFQDYANNPPFVGVPAGVVNIKLGQAPNVDDAVLVGISSGRIGVDRAALLRNDSEPGGEISFVGVTPMIIPSLATDLGSLAVADYDHDGRDDFFACQPGQGSSQLYRQGAGVFAQVTDAAFAGVASHWLSNVACAAWVDLDRDGYLELHLGRSTSAHGRDDDVVLRYDPQTGTFAEVEDLLALAGSTSRIAWAVVDDSGDLTAALAHDDAILLARETAGGYTVTPVLTEVPAGLVSSLQWADFDRDNQLDLLVVYRRVGGVGGAMVAAIGYTEAGAIVRWQELPTSGQAFTAGYPLDYDLDGWTDVLLYAATGEPPLLLANQQYLGGWAAGFHDVSREVGLRPADPGERRPSALLAGDFNRDGDLDLLFGNADASAGTLLKSVRPDGSETPSGNWIGLRLATASGMPPLGATVVLTTATGEPLGTRTVDGGGSPHQRSRDLVFGLGDDDGGVTARIRWPDRRLEVKTPLAAGTVHTITESSAFTINGDSLTKVIEYDPHYKTYDFVFTWTTDHWTQPGKDKVHLAAVSGAPCEAMPVTLQAGGDGAVTARITHQAATGTFRHEVRWVGRSCLPGCWYRVTGIESTLGANTVSHVPAAPTGRFQFEFCLQSQ